MILLGNSTSEHDIQTEKSRFSGPFSSSSKFMGRHTTLEESDSRIIRKPCMSIKGNVAKVQ